MQAIDKLIIQFDALQEQFNILAILMGINFVCILLLAFGMTFYIEGRIGKIYKHYLYMKDVIDELEKKFGVIKERQERQRAKDRIGKM